MDNLRAVGSMWVLDRLAVRLALLLSVALLPLGILAVVTSLDNRRTDLRSAERALVSMTAETAGGRRALVESAFATARALARPTLERLDDPEACREMVADTVRRSGVYSFVGFIEADGIMRCHSSSDPDAPEADTEPRDFTGSAVFRRLIEDPTPLVYRVDVGAVTRRAVLVTSQPVFDGGALRGFLTVSTPLEYFRWLGWESDADTDLRPILFNQRGDVLSAGVDEDVADLLPRGRTLASLVEEGGPAVFEGETAAGRDAVFAVASLVPGQLYVLGVWDANSSQAAALGVERWSIAFPLLMWLSSIGVVYFALYFLVIRHLRRLGQQMRRFALGDRSLPSPPPQSMSHELREVHKTFFKMAMLVARDEAELSAALAEKDAVLRERTVLLKEVHHRVKNNLQLIASILNLQMRRLRDPRTRRVLQNIQDRVIGLATIHRNLYQSEHISELRADLLVEELLRHLFAVGAEGDTSIDLETDLDPMNLQADQLVPLSLLVTEAVTNALKYVGNPEGGGRPWMRIRLAVEGSSVLLRVTNSLGPETGPPGGDEVSSSGLGAELIDAFAMQLGATEIEKGRIDDAGSARWELSLRFEAGIEDHAPPVAAAAG